MNKDNPGDPLYVIFVHDYRHDSAFPLSSSGANIDLYGTEGGYRHYTVPKQEPLPENKSRYWIIGRLDPLERFHAKNILVSGAPSGSQTLGDFIISFFKD